MMGININDKLYPFTEWILNGMKTVETRRTDSLRPYVGQRIGIVRTGKGKATLVGYATITEVVRYETVESFRADEGRHLVEAGSKFDCDSKGKFGYVLSDVVKVEPTVVTTKGIVARRIDEQ